MDRLPVTMAYLIAVGFLILALHVTRADGAITCPACPNGFQQDVAVDRDTVFACTEGNEPEANRIEFQVEREPGTTSPPLVATGCQMEFAIYRRERMRTHARFCNDTTCGAWSPYSHWIGRLELFPICYSDVDGNDVVNANDFLLFRGDYLRGCR